MESFNQRSISRAHLTVRLHSNNSADQRAPPCLSSLAGHLSKALLAMRHARSGHYGNVESKLRALTDRLIVRGYSRRWHWLLSSRDKCLVQLIIIVSNIS